MLMVRTRRKRRRVADAEQLREQFNQRADELAEALESAREALSRASAEVSRRSAEAGKLARKGAEAGRAAARETLDRLPEPERVAEMTRRAADTLFPQLARKRKAQRRKRRRRLLLGGAGLAGLGLVAGWLTAPRPGTEARQAVKERAARASEAARQRLEGARAGGRPAELRTGPAPAPETEPQQSDRVGQQP